LPPDERSGGLKSTPRRTVSLPAGPWRRQQDVIGDYLVAVNPNLTPVMTSFARSACAASLLSTFILVQAGCSGAPP
jgi:hypothetical protein